jgi:predicted phosphodiesterase
MAVWVTTDLHGNYSLWEQIKNFLKEDDTLIFLGDAIDRGDRGFEIFMELLDDERVCYLRGNHEQMMYDSYYYKGDLGNEFFKHWTLKDNGGRQTLNNMQPYDHDTRMKYINKIASLPFYAEYENDIGIKFFLCHAGATLGNYFNNLDESRKRDKLLWDRNHFNFPWPNDEKLANTVVVHGHTPILLMKQWYGYNASGLAPLVYESNHKINLDAATPNTGLAFLYNLDTLKYELFVSENLKEENNV